MAHVLRGAEARWPRAREVDWLNPEQLVEEGFRRSRVVMMNEALSGLMHCPRNRRVGTGVMAMASACGARLLAMEVMATPGAPARAGGVLDQPDMRAMIDEAERQGLRVMGYDTDDELTPLRLRTKVKSAAFTNWRDASQAANLARLLAELAPDQRMLVWSANLHHAKVRFMQYRPMGWRFWNITGVEPFVIDQTVTVFFTRRHRDSPVLRWARWTLRRRGGDAGFVWADGLPRLSPGADAWLLSLDNRME
jgi:hypothetical protein